MTRNSNFKVISDAYVDDIKWYTIRCTKEVAAWVHENFKEQLYEHIDETWHISYNRFDIPEKLYIVLALRWS